MTKPQWFTYLTSLLLNATAIVLGFQQRQWSTVALASLIIAIVSAVALQETRQKRN